MIVEKTSRMKAMTTSDVTKQPAVQWSLFYLTIRTPIARPADRYRHQPVSTVMKSNLILFPYLFHSYIIKAIYHLYPKHWLEPYKHNNGLKHEWSDAKHFLQQEDLRRHRAGERKQRDLTSISTPSHFTLDLTKNRKLAVVWFEQDKLPFSAPSKTVSLSE